MSITDRKKAWNDLILKINGILSKYGINEKISKNDICVTEETISDLVKSEAKLSNAIANFLWPSIKSAVVYHYTSMAAIENIISTNIFRLYNISKNSSAGEVITFCETNNLEGYLEKDKNGVQIYETLIFPNTFCGCFTDTSINIKKENYFWNVFATKSGKREGARLKIRIKASLPDFRKIRYNLSDDVSIKLLSDLSMCSLKNFKREFILKGISKYCSFFVPSDFQIENEYRILYRIWDDSVLKPKNDGNYTFLELPLNSLSNCGYELKIMEVHAERKPKMNDKYYFSKREV